MSLMMWLMFSTKRVVLDPLTELTDAAHRIELGDFTRRAPDAARRMRSAC